MESLSSQCCSSVKWFISYLSFCFCEVEADDFGLMLAAKACFAVREAPAFWLQKELEDETEDSQEMQLIFQRVQHTRTEQVT